jgi:hypothetical protein
MTKDNILAFRPGRRSNAKPLIGLYSESGCGKTYSALLLARGFVGPNGRIGMIETESGRGEAYSDPAEYPEIGGYEVLPLHGNFSPEIYGKAIETAEKAGLNALIIDSASHEWEGIGGVLMMAAENEANGKKGQLVWQKPKLDHQRHFMLRFMQSPIPLVILCMRAKYPMTQRQVNGRTEWTRSEKLEPKQSDDILSEMFVHGWMDELHNFHLTKCTAKALEPVFLSEAPITRQTGEELAAWARGEKTADRYTALLADAEEAAMSGMDILRRYWQALVPADYALLKAQATRLKGIAKRADDASHDPIMDGLERETPADKTAAE